MDLYEFENKFDFYCKRRRYTQAEIANVLKVNRSTITRWKQQGNTIPEARLLHLCMLFDLDENERIEFFKLAGRERYLKLVAGVLAESRDSGEDVLKVFFIQPFDDLVGRWFQSFLNAFSDIATLTVEYINNEMPGPKINQIKECAFVCAIFSKENGHIPHWLQSNLEMAHKGNKPVIAFVEKGTPQNVLDSLENITQCQWFKRDCVGNDAPKYLHHICNTRDTILKALGKDRASLREANAFLRAALKSQNDKVESLEDQKYRLDDL